MANRSISARGWLRFALALLAAACGSSSKSTSTDDVGDARQLVTTAPAASCQPASYGGREYWFCSNFANHAEAAATCAKSGLHLVRIDDEAENAFVDQRACSKSSKTWLGAVAGAGTWRWSDGEAFWSGGRAGHAIDGLFERWDHQQPNNDAHHTCAGMDRSGDWEAWSCESHSAFVCESDPVSTPPGAPDPSCRGYELDGRPYWFCSGAKNATDARASCQGAGMDLASIESSSENRFIASHAPTASFVGLTDRSREGSWKWLATNSLAYCSGDCGSRGAYQGSFNSWARDQPEGSHCNYSVIGQRAYFTCSDSLSWDDARLACSGAGMSLGRVDSAAENGSLASMRDAWLGGTDAGHEADWRWLDGKSFWSSRAVPGQFSNWARQQPGVDANRNCLAFSQSKGEWRAASCSETRQFVCEGAPIADPQLPDLADCATVAAGSGAWTATRCDKPNGYVCEPPPADVNQVLDDVADYVRDDFRLGPSRLKSVVFKAEANVTNPFERYSERFGIRDCLDGMAPNGAPSAVPGSDLQAQDFRQTYRGVQLSSRGYTVKRAPDGRVVSLSGRFEPNVSVDVSPKVSAKSALEVALDKVGVSKSDRKRINVPEPHLGIYPTSQGRRATWQLAYQFAIPKTPGHRAHAVVVSAIDSHVVTSRDDREQACEFSVVDPQGPIPTATTINVTAQQQQTWKDPSQAQASFLAGAPFPYLLQTNGVSSDPNSPVSGRPSIFTTCPEAVEGDGSVAASKTQSIQVTDGSPDNEPGAAFYMAVQRCVDFLGSDIKSSTGAPWVGMDGEGKAPIPIQLFKLSPDDPDATPYYSRVDKAIHFSADETPALGATLDIACHELTHGIWHHLGQTSNTGDPETDSLTEGFSDLFGIAAKAAFRNDAASTWCFGGDQFNNSRCYRNLQTPELSSTFNCEVLTASGPLPLYRHCPSVYAGPDFCQLARVCEGHNDNKDCCSPHRNSTVFSHWFYLATHGDEGRNQAACNYSVPAADPDLRTSMREVLNVALHAVENKDFAPLTGYEGVADAIIKTARDELGDASPVTEAISHAWYAVNVTEDLLDSETKTVTPARNEQLVNPWMRFFWPLTKDVAEYDVQISRTPFDSPEVDFEQPGVHAEIYSDAEVEGLAIGFLKVALPYESRERWYWRVRPHSNDAWADSPWRSDGGGHDGAEESGSDPRRLLRQGRDARLASGGGSA